MKHVQKQVLLWHSAQAMYELVAGVEHYPNFLPWCSAAHILERGDQSMKARLHLHFAGLTHDFTTLNRMQPGRQLTMELVDGPFSMLDGRWDFTPLGPNSGPKGCKVEFDMRYAFKSAALEAVVSPVFDRIAATFVDAFVKRADVVHGAGA
jgi:ribosome-associated toxin RatA of RatAB toxin-antitoxin module